MKIDKKEFWEKKIIGWEDLRYKKNESVFNLFEKNVDKTNNTLIFRLNFAFEILEPLIKNKKVVELGCGSGFLAKKFIEIAANSGADAIKVEAFKAEDFAHYKKNIHIYGTSNGLVKENYY